MYQKIKSYIRYLLRRKTKYSVHAPFVFDFLTKCLENPIPKTEFSKFLRYRNSYLNSSENVLVTDFGAGSQIFNSNTRKVKDIALIAGMSLAKAKIMFKLLQYFNPNSVLEIGTSIGISTGLFKIASPNIHITTLEGCSQTAQKAKEFFNKNHFDNIKQVVGEFSQTLPEVINHQKYDLVFFDGNHRKEPTLEYFNSCLKVVQNNTLFIFDDIHWSEDMEEAWDLICSHSMVSVSIDLYDVGLVFFRKESTKQHFILKK